VVAVFLWFKEVGVAILAAKHAGMNFVAEHHFANSFGLNLHITGVAGRTVASHAKGGVAIVTSSARVAVFHCFHRRLVAVILRHEESRVALTTTKHVAVSIMAEQHIAHFSGPYRYIASVAGGAVAFDAERGPSIMACSAGAPLLHIFHTDVITISLLLEKPRMAKFTVGTMLVMAENDLADSLGLDGNFIGHRGHATHISHAYCIEA